MTDKATTTATDVRAPDWEPSNVRYKREHPSSSLHKWCLQRIKHLFRSSRAPELKDTSDSMKDDRIISAKSPSKATEASSTTVARKKTAAESWFVTSTPNYNPDCGNHHHQSGDGYNSGGGGGGSGWVGDSGTGCSGANAGDNSGGTGGHSSGCDGGGGEWGGDSGGGGGDSGGGGGDGGAGCD